MSRPRWKISLAAVVVILLSTTPSAHALIRYIAFGDSISFGVGDPDEKGYPIKLKRMLEKNLDEDVQVLKSAVPGEETSAALARIDEALATGGDALLLMEGTNDVSRIWDGTLSVETVVANLDAMALAAKRRGIEPIHATVFPRSPKSTRDWTNGLTSGLAREIRELASSRKRRLVDIYEAFDPQIVQDAYEVYYFSSFDPVGHPNEEGYKRIAETFLNVLLEVDVTPPVVGPFFPGTVPLEIPPDTEFIVPIYEPRGAAGINQKFSTLLINGKPVGDYDGNRRRLELLFQDEEAVGCRVVLAYRSQDRADPPNVAERILGLYDVTDREVLTGDVDFDCLVDGADLVSLGWGFGAEAGDTRYQRRLDLNVDGIIDNRDIKILKKKFSRSSL